MRTLKLMTMDGGPAALIQVRLLRYMEQQIPGFFAATDVLAGTSDGSFMAVYMAAHIHEGDNADVAAAMVDYSNEINEAFHATLCALLRLGSGLRSMDRAGPLRRILEKNLGALTLAEMNRGAGHRWLGAVSFNKSLWAPKYFRSFGPLEAAEKKRTIVDVAMASSAFPVVMPIHRSRFDGYDYLDGAIVANNPTMATIPELLVHFLPDIARSNGGVLTYERDALNALTVLALGTTQPPSMPGWMPRCLKWMLGGELQWGWLRWLISDPIFEADLLFSGSGEEVSREAEHLLRRFDADPLDQPYFRSSPDTNQIGQLFSVYLRPWKEVERQLDLAADRIAHSEWMTWLLAWVKRNWMVNNTLVAVPGDVKSGAPG